MTVCARKLGIPARYVVGYLPDANGTPSKQFSGMNDYVVRQKDLHAW
ncbi:transglutaminase domain-containing protein, partial [Pseudomonas aeruginosa]